MYQFAAYIGGEWLFAGFDEHEECAVMFIDMVDSLFGDGTAFVAKLPDKADHNPIADAAAQHANIESMKQTLAKLETGALDLDEALQSLKDFNK